MAEGLGSVKFMKPRCFLSAALAGILVASPLVAEAGTLTLAGNTGPTAFGTLSGGPKCKTGGITINKWININKNISIWKPINIDNNIDIQKNIWINKNIQINKNITINKGSSSAEALAFAAAGTASTAAATVYAGGYLQETEVNRGVETIGGQVETSQACRMQEATVVKAIHAVCVAAEGREFAASHMLGDTWIESSYEGEVVRCVPGAYLKVVVGDVVESDQGMAGTYEHGQLLVCREGQALRHYKDGMLKCETAVPVKDCTERTNLRRYGTGDFFFSYRSQVCAAAPAEAQARPVDLNGMTLEGGVGPGY
jgi:hypothetical protein